MKNTFIGVYSTKDTSNLRNARGSTRKKYWFVWETEGNSFLVQPLNAALEPTGAQTNISRRDFKRLYKSEPSILAVPLSKENDSANAARSAFAQPARLRNATLKASQKNEGNFKAPLDLDLLDSTGLQTEHELRARFGSAIAQLKRGRKEDALRALRKLASENNGVTRGHKHIFAEFGINLRRSKLPDLALLHNKRVLELDPDDGNAHFNVARIYYELGDLRGARKHLQTALELIPDSEYILAFLNFLDSGKKISRPAGI